MTISLALLHLPLAHADDGEKQDFAARTIADSVGEFSGKQGQYNWYYGYYDGDSSIPYSNEDFEELPQFDGRWIIDSSIYWTALSADGGHPNGQITSGGRRPAKHWTVRRWVSEVTGAVTVAGRLSKRHAGSQGDGVTGYIIVDGEVVWSQHIGGDDTAGVNYTIDVLVSSGSVVDFALAPTRNDWQDTSRFTAIIVRKKQITLQEQFSDLIDGVLSGLKTGKPGTIVFSGFVSRDGRASRLEKRLDEIAVLKIAEVDAFHLVGRDVLDRVLDEEQTSRFELRDTSVAIRIGRLLGADYVVTGSIIEMTSLVAIFGRIVNISTENTEAASQVMVSKKGAILDLLSQ